MRIGCAKADICHTAFNKLHFRVIRIDLFHLVKKQIQLIFNIGKDGIYKFKGLLGESSIQVESGKAKFLDSPCENKNCIQSGEISVNGQWAACLPNGIFINIEGKNKENTFDAVSN